MSKLTDKIVGLLKATEANSQRGLVALDFQETYLTIRDILADVRELEQERDMRWEQWRAEQIEKARIEKQYHLAMDAICRLNTSCQAYSVNAHALIARARQAKREAYEHALALTVTPDEFKQGRRSAHIRADIQAAIDALDTEEPAPVTCDRCGVQTGGYGTVTSDDGTVCEECNNDALDTEADSDE